MSNEETGLAASRRTPRQGVGGSPVGSWLTIVLAVVAVVAGFLILRNITDDSSATSPNDPGASEVGAEAADPNDTLVDVSIPVTEVTTTTTTLPRTTEGASVMVANANTVGQSAGGMSRTLEEAGYTVVDPVNATGPNLTASIVYFDGAQESAEAIARSVALDLGGVEVLPVSTPAPTDSGDIGEAGVLVLLGDDEAGKTLEELAPEEADAGGVAAPDPSDGDVPVTAPEDANTGGDAETDDADE